MSASRSWYSIRNAAAGAEVHVYDAIGGPDGVSAKEFAKDLKAHANAKTLTIRINSPGGSCFDGIAIFNQLKRHPARKTVHVDGIAASAASVICMAGDEIVMPDNTIMMVHRPYALVLGNAGDMQAMVEALNRVEDAMVLAYRRSRQTDARIRALLAAETWMGAQEAVDLGFADRVVDAVAIAAHFDLSRFGYRNVPQPGAAASWDRVIRGRFPRADVGGAAAGRSPPGPDTRS
jgi:ATP-dependent protease ClpP protease subunit